MYGNGKEAMNWVAWSLGLFLIAVMLIVSGYMFVVYLRSQHKKNQEDEQRRIEEQKTFREQLAQNQAVSTITELNNESTPVEQKSEKSENPESSRIDDSSLKSSGEKIEKPVETVVVSQAKTVPTATAAPKSGSAEPSTEELSVRKSLTDLKPITKPAEKNNGEVSVEIAPDTPVSIPPVEKRVTSAEKAPGSSTGSDISTYVISSQRSEVNNYNQLEAGRTPPTFTNTENILHRTSSIDSFVPSTAVPSSLGTPPTITAPMAQQSSETYVSVTTPPNAKK